MLQYNKEKEKFIDYVINENLVTTVNELLQNSTLF